MRIEGYFQAEAKEELAFDLVVDTDGKIDVVWDLGGVCNSMLQEIISGDFMMRFYNKDFEIAEKKVDPSSSLKEKVQFFMQF